MPYIELVDRVYNGPGYIDLHKPDGRIWEARFDLMPLSNGSNSTLLRSYLAACGLTLTRASSATVQTSASTLVTSGIAVDDPRFGSNGTASGLVIEEGRTNSAKDCQDRSTVSWNAGTGTPTYNYATGPDGLVLSDRDVCASAAFGRYQTVAVAASTVYAVSQWARRGVIGVAGSNGLSLSDATNTGSLESALADAWGRVSTQFTTAAAATALTYAPVEGRAVYGLTAQARDTVTDLVQVEAGRFPTEAIITAGATATRSPERLALASSSSVVIGGRLCLEICVTAKMASTDYTGTQAYLWSIDGNNQCYVDKATGKLFVLCNGASFSTPTNPTWNAGDSVCFWVEAGGGALQTVVKYRVNGGATVTLGTSGSPQAKLSTGPLELANYITGRQFSGWFQYFRAWAPGRRPAWAA